MITLVLLAGGFAVGGLVIGGLVWAYMATERNLWREIWKTEATLRARDRATRAGEIDSLPPHFRAPPLRPKQRPAPGFMRRFLSRS